MINRNESFVEKESQWYRYRLSYSNVEKCKLHLAVTQVAKLCTRAFLLFAHKKRFIDLAHQLTRFTVLCCEEHYSPEDEKLYEQN